MKQKNIRCTSRVAILSLALLSLLFESAADANINGPDFQNFNPTTDGLDFVTVHSSQTLFPGVINLGAFANYAANVLPELAGADGSTSSRVSGADLNVGAGLSRNWDFGFSFAYFLSSETSGSTSTTRGDLSETGLNEIRVNSKYRFLKLSGGGGLAGVVSTNLNMIKNNPYYGSGAGPTFNFELAFDRPVLSNYLLGLNLGFRKRSPGTPLAGVPIEPFHDQLIASLALSRYFAGIDSRGIFEIFGSQPVQNVRQDTDRNSRNLEFLLGVKRDVTSQLALHFGGGSKVTAGTASPDWRIYAGLNYNFTAVAPKQEAPDQDELLPLAAVVPIEAKASVDGALAETPAVSPKDRVSSWADFDPEKFQPPTPVAYAVPALIAGAFLPIRETVRLFGVNFDFDSASVRPEFSEQMKKLVNYVKETPEFTELVVSGHTDSVGSNNYNLRLSQKRALAIKTLLVKEYGLSPLKVRAVGFGELRPIAENGSYQGRMRNRRVDFFINRDAPVAPLMRPKSNSSSMSEVGYNSY